MNGRQAKLRRQLSGKDRTIAIQLTDAGVKHIIRLAYRQGYENGADATIKAACESHEHGAEFEPSKVREPAEVRVDYVASELCRKILEAMQAEKEKIVKQVILSPSSDLSGVN